MGSEVPDAEGALYQPIPEECGVDDGANERMKQNRKEGKDQK